MTECARCGRCCEVISLGFSMDALVSGKVIPALPYDGEFIKKYWKELTPIEAWHINPDKTFFPGRHYYKCTKYDKFRHTCTAHKFKPPVCEGFPWYGQAPHNDALYWDGCAFNRDIVLEGI